jgi:hypothetical protein
MMDGWVGNGNTRRGDDAGRVFSKGVNEVDERYGDFRSVSANRYIASAPTVIGSQKSEKIWKPRATMAIPAKMWM